MREPEVAQFFGAVVPRIEGILHVHNMPESRPKVKGRASR
jgi:hypothetical protein